MLALLLYVWLQTGVAAVGMRAHADRSALVLGEALTLEVLVQGATAEELSGDLDLDVLKQNFEVYGVSRSTQTPQRNDKPVPSLLTFTVTLYPLHAGKLSIPALHFHDASSRPLEITVSDSGDNIGRVTVRTGIVDASPHVRQATVLYLDIYDQGVRLWSPPGRPSASGIDLQALQSSRRKVVLDKRRYVVQRYAWALTALRDGPLDVRFPMLEASRFGTQLRYAAPAVHFFVQPVPAYLPVFVPIGAPRLRAMPLPVEIGLGRPLNWTLEVEGSGISEEAVLRALSSSIADSDALRFYPPSIRSTAFDASDAPLRTMQVQIPFQALRAGDITLPEIVLPYYDPVREQVGNVRLAAQRLHVVDSLGTLLRRIAGGLAILLALGTAAYLSLRAYRRKRTRRRSLARIAAAGSALELKNALLAFDVSSRSAQPATLQQWLARMCASYERTTGLPQWVEEIESACFGRVPTADDFALLRDEVRRCMQRLRRRRRMDGDRDRHVPEPGTASVGSILPARRGR